jgi:hypothetical protein
MSRVPGELAFLAALFLLSSCDRLGNRPPTATEVFHLRSECADLAAKIRTLHPGFGVSDNVLSHYDPHTNRCYVQLTDIGQDLMHSLYDGQTGDLLASTIRSMNEDSTFKSGEVKGGLKNLPADTEARYKAAEDFIAAMMADDRKQ